MTLIECSKCNSELSNQARNCAKCGTTTSKPKRSLLGNIIKWIFIIFNILMLFCLLKGFGASSEVMQRSTTSAGRAGAALGLGIASMMILFIWAMGDLIIGSLVYFTKPRD